MADVQQNGLSEKIKRIAPSATLALNAKAKEMIAKGINVLNFAIGEPDFNTPENIKDAAKKAIDENFTKYTAATGIPELRDAIAAKFKKDNGITYSAAEIVVGSGGKPLLYGALVALCNPGDEVILSAPYWVSYVEMIKLADGVPVIVNAREKDEFEIKASAIEAAITPKTKVVLLNSPSNPTGGIISEEEFRKIADLAVKHNLYIISDEMYEQLLYEGKHFSIASVSEDLRNRVVTVNGASKTYAMTGWRIGYLGAPKIIADAIGNFLSHINGNANSIAQKACLEAIVGPQDEVLRMKEEFKKRRDRFVEGLNEVKGINCLKPKGAFYVYPNFSKLFTAEISDSAKMGDYLLEKVFIAAVPGAEFGTKEHIRFSYATSMETIEECIKRLKELFIT